MYIPFQFPLSIRDIFIFFLAWLILSGISLLLTRDDKTGAAIRHLQFGFFVCSFIILILLATGAWRI